MQQSVSNTISMPEKEKLNSLSQNTKIVLCLLSFNLATQIDDSILCTLQSGSLHFKRTNLRLVSYFSCWIVLKAQLRIHFASSPNVTPRLQLSDKHRVSETHCISLSARLCQRRYEPPHSIFAKRIE